MTHRLALFGVLLLASIATPLAADDTDLSLLALSEAARGRVLTREALAEGPSGLLAQATGIDSFPVTCVTPLLTPDRQQAVPLPSVEPDALRDARAILAARPLLAAERTTTADQGFVIHFAGDAASAAGLMAADRDRDGSPDLVNRVAEVLSAARSHLDALGYPDPAGEGTVIDVYLVRLGRGIEGYVATPWPPAGFPGAGGPFVVLDAALGSDRIGPAVMHQMAHLSLTKLSAAAPAWWDEASAAFLSFAATGDVSGSRSAIGARQNAAGRSLSSDDLLLMRGAILWPLFLAERTGNPDLVRQIWSAIGQGSLDLPDATDLILRRAAGIGLADALREYAGWNLFTGARDDGRHYSFGRSFPEGKLPVLGPGLPFDLGPVEPIEALGSVAFRISAGGEVGALDLALRAEGGEAGADLLVFYRQHGDQPVLVPIAIDGDGRGRVSVPWEEALEAWLILRNGAADPDRTTSFEVRGALDPFAPFDLASFTSEAAGGSIVLEWTTASERGLLGWNVYRALHPTGPFVRLNRIAIPAYGDGTQETGYVFVDEIERGGEGRYYYVIEGLTQSGLTRRSHLTSARTSGRP